MSLSLSRMKCVILAAVSLLFVNHGASAARPTNSYGPEGCVSLDRSPSGTCILRTNCSAVNTSLFEYEFDCVSASAVLRHSYGLGGFDPVEAFDTGVPCQQCLPPQHALPGAQRSARRSAAPYTHDVAPVPSRLLPAAAAHSPTAAALPVAQRAHTVERAVPAPMPTHALTVLRAKEAPPGILDPTWSSEVSRYGPKECVSTWKSKRGHCIVRTECKGVDTKDYDFGMVCVDKEGVPTRHFFGKNSFQAAETFDTGVKCDRCIGLGTMSKEMRLRGTVASIMKEVGGLKGEMLNISKSLSKLDTKVFPKTSVAQSPAAAKPSVNQNNAASSKPTEPEKAQPVLVHHKSRRAEHSKKQHSYVKASARKERGLKLQRRQHEKMKRLTKERKQRKEEEAEQDNAEVVEQRDREEEEEQEEEEEEEDEEQDDEQDMRRALDRDAEEQLQAEDAQAVEELNYERRVEKRVNARRHSKRHRMHHPNRYHHRRHHRPAHGVVDAREQAFRLLDADGSGTVSESEWARSVSVVGQPQEVKEGRVTIVPAAS